MPLSGPHPVSGQLQVKIPAKLARLLHIAGGDEIFWLVSEDEPGALILLPSEVVERRYAMGARLESLDQDAGAELGDVSSEPHAQRHET